MNADLLITITMALVLANLVNKTLVNPLINKIFGGSSKAQSGSSKNIESGATSTNKQMGK